MNIAEAIQYPFTKKNWKKPFITLAVGYFLIWTVSMFLWLVMVFVPPMGEGDNVVAMGAFTLTIIMYGLVGLFSLPFGFYVYGYSLEVLDAYKSGADEIPTHNNIGTKLLEGFKFSFVNFVYSLPLVAFTFLIIVVPTLGILAGGLDFNNLDTSTLLFLGCLFALLVLVLIAIFIAYGMIISPAVLYEYHKRRSIGDALNIGNVIATAKIGWKQFVIASLSYFAGITALNSIAYFTLCISFLVYPITFAYIAYLYGALFAEAFKEVDALKLKK
jgi:hypothetical protein